MERKYGIPYLTGTPVGDGGIILSKVKSFLEKGILEDEGGREKSSSAAKKVLVAGDQIISRSICEEAERIHPGISFVSGTIFDFSSEEARAVDLFIRDESDFRKIVNSGEFAGIVSDPLVEELLTESAKKGTKFFPLPNVAVSSKVCWKDTINILGKEMSSFLSKITV